MSDVTTRHVTPADLPLISALHARVFGPGRFARTAYRVREGTAPVSLFCRVAFLDQRMVAALRFTEVMLGSACGGLLLGPLAVDPQFAGQGYGRRLVAEGMAQARQAGVKFVVLIGDEPYYQKFGFAQVRPGSVSFPGPVDPARILVAELESGALTTACGMVRPAAAAFLAEGRVAPLPLRK